uniref:Putative LOC100203217 [Hydra vulgaris] n=1 Tax=Lepeophtheirus salmonis TaxID=72036 RepID=A0A0K2TJ01_LEPSM
MVESMNGRFSNKFHFHTICGICSFLSTEGDPWIYFDLYDFADEYPLQSAEANLLMGQDYYWEIVRNKFIRPNHGNLVALNTPFGYVLN